MQQISNSKGGKKGVWRHENVYICLERNFPLKMENTKPEGGSTTVNIKIKWREFSIFSFSKKAENNIDKLK